jgi:hypothetical protein
MMFGQWVQLFVKAGDMLGAIIVGQSANAQFVQHLGSLGWRALLAIERNDAPGDQIVATKRIGFALGMCGQTAATESDIGPEQVAWLEHNGTCRWGDEELARLYRVP